MLVVDNLSPFTGDILQCLEKIGIKYLCIKYYDVFSLATIGSDVKYDKVILSGRHKNSREINVANSRLIRQYYETKKSILGICYGAEIIALALGGTIRRMDTGNMKGRISIRINRGSPLVSDHKELMVYESHRYCVAKLPDDFYSVASSENCEHEIFSHKEKKIFGTQFHPEKSEADGLVILSNFVKV